MPSLERFILHRLAELDRQVRQAYGEYRFQDVARDVLGFCQDELSSLFFDVRRDSLYCDPPGSPKRCAARTVLNDVFERLTIWLAPLLPFTMEEAWTTRFPEAGSNCLRVFPDTPTDWPVDDVEGKWGAISAVISVVTGALELERREKRIGASLEAAPKVYIANPLLMAELADLSEADLAEIFRTSGVTLIEGEGPPTAFRLPDVEGVAVEPERVPPENCKCARCWRVLSEVKAPKMLCLRCEEAVETWDRAHATEAA